MERPKVVSFNENLTCGLCKGYLIEATTITTCLHSFCHSCIVKNLSQQQGEKSYCPVCSDLNLPDVAPVTAQDLRSDHLLQTIVYKVVPLLYEKEQKRRSDYRNNLNSGKSEIDKKNKNKQNHPSGFHIFSSSDVVNVQISEMEFGTDGESYVGNDDNNNNNNKKENVDQQLKCRYLLCPVLLKMSHLKKFLMQKIYGSNPGCNVILCSHGKPLEDDICLADICYIFGLQKTTCISIKYIAYLLPKIVTKDQVASEVERETAEPPLDESSAEIIPNCSLQPEESHDVDDSSNVVDISTSTSMSSHSASDRSDNPESDGKNLISDAGEQDFSMENISTQELTPVQTSTEVVPEVVNVNVDVCEQSLDQNFAVETSAAVTSLDEHVSIVSNNNDEDTKSKECEQHLNNEKVTELVHEKLAPTDTVADVFVPPFSSPSSASAMMEPPPSTVAMAAKLTTPTKEVDSDDHDRMSESSSDTTMASPTPTSSTSAPMKPCKVILYRLPTAYFLKSNKKRKHSVANDADEDDDVEVPESKIEQSVEKSLHPPVKKKKLLDGHPKSTVRNLMVKYKAHLKKLLELKETIRQLRKQNKSKSKNPNCKIMTKVVEVEDVVEEIGRAEPIISEVSLNTTISIVTPISSSPIASTRPLAEDSNSNKDDRVDNCNVALTKTSASLKDISQSISASDKQDISRNLQQTVESIKQNIGHQNEKLEPELGLTSKGVNILPPCLSDASKQSSTTCTSNFSSDSPMISKCLSNATDVSWLLKYARLQAVSNLDKIGTRVVESGGFISRCPDVQMPMVLQKRSLLDFVRLPHNRQRCSNRVNNFHNTSAAIRSNFRPAIPASVPNYLRPAYNQIINQTSDLESLRHYFSALGNQQVESPLNNSNITSLDLMTYLERNQPSINGMSLGNHSLAACFPLTLNGCTPTARHNFMQTQRQSVSTQTHLDLINQYFCRRSKPAPSVFAGRMRPMINKRSFNHAFGPDVVTKRSFPASSKKIRYADEDYLNRIASVNPMIKDNNHVHSGNLETINAHKLFPLSSVMTPAYRHIFTELPSKSCGPILRPLSSVNPNRVICLTPPTDALKKQLICNGPSEISSSQALPSSRPRSSSANAAEVYETLAAGASGGTVDSMKNLAAPLIDMAQSLSSLSYDCQMDDKNTLQNCSLLANQLSPRQKDSFYSIPRKSLFPIFSKSSKLNIPNLQTQNIFPSNKSMFKELSTLSVPHQTRKCAVPTPQFPLSGWNSANVNANDSFVRMNDNVTLDLSKKRKKMDPNVFGEALKSDISKNYKAVKSLASLSAVRSSAGNKSSDSQSIMSNTAFLSFLTMTSLSIAKQTPPTTSSLKDKMSPCDREESSGSECPNVIDFRRSLPVTSFKLCDLKNLPFSTFVSTTSNIDSFSFVDGSNISNAPGKNNDPNTDVKDTTGNYNENDFTQIDAVLLEINGNQSNKSNKAQSHVLDTSTRVTSSSCSTSDVPSSSPHDDPKNQEDSTTSSDVVVGSVVDLVSDNCCDVLQKVEDPSDGNMLTNEKIGNNLPTAQDNGKEISGSFVQLKHVQENIIIQGCNALPEIDNPNSDALLSNSANNDIKQNIDNDRDIIKSSKSNDSTPLEITTNATNTLDNLQNETTDGYCNSETTEGPTDQIIKATSSESLTTFKINPDGGVLSSGDDVVDVEHPNSSLVAQHKPGNTIINDEGRSDDVVSSDRMQCDRDDQVDDNDGREINTSIKLNRLEEKFESKDVDDSRPMNSRADSETSEVNDKSVLDFDASMNFSSEIID